MASPHHYITTPTSAHWALYGVIVTRCARSHHHITISLHHHIEAYQRSGSPHTAPGSKLYGREVRARFSTDHEKQVPDLPGYERKNLDYLLLHIVDPNADIREGSVNYALITTTGQHLSGIMIGHSGQVVRLRSLSGAVSSFAKDQIRSCGPCRYPPCPNACWISSRIRNCSICSLI